MLLHLVRPVRRSLVYLALVGLWSNNLVTCLHDKFIIELLSTVRNQLFIHQLYCFLVGDLSRHQLCALLSVILHS